MIDRKIVLALGCYLCVALGSTGSSAQHSHPGGSRDGGTEKLGTISFLTSCSAGAQAEFETAVALLHSFQYAQAATAFENAAAKDPICAMAHWGMAMTRWHALWEQPDGPTRERGWADVEKA